MTECLKYSPISHAHITRIHHPELDADIDGRSVVRYLRFVQPVRLDRLELTKHLSGRSAPSVLTHPAHLLVSTLVRKTGRWKLCRDVNIEPDPRNWGEGIDEDTPRQEVDAHFLKVRDTQKVIVVELDGLETDLLRVECDREHPVWPNHMEFNGNRFHVPFAILNTLKAFGELSSSEREPPAHVPLLKTVGMAPAAPEGMTCRRRGESIIFEGSHLSIGFSLRRPMLTQLGWDAHGELSGQQRLACRRPLFADFNKGMSGPLLITPWSDHGAHLWTGTLQVEGNRVIYGDLESVSGLRLSATFIVEPERLILRLTQRCDKHIHAIESEAWRVVFDLTRGMTGVAANPTRATGRCGEIELPCLVAGDGNGCLSVELLEGDPRDVHAAVESYRTSKEVSFGVSLGHRPSTTDNTLLATGEISATLAFTISDLLPASECPEKAGPGVRRHWASNFSCYRPEFGGFANNAAASSCHCNQHSQIDVAAFTAKAACGFDPLTAARFTIGRALMDGSGYSYWRNLYLDSDPVLVSSAGRIFQADGNAGWLNALRPALVAAAQRMLTTMGDDGLAVCRSLSGNSGSYRWSSSAFDMVGFGHLDAYVNAWTYRGLRNAAALLRVVGNNELSDHCTEAADTLRANYALHLVNPKTGWVMGWRSRDGEIHDYAYLWVNGVACAFGLLDSETARTALRNLEALRDEMGLRSARGGLPYNLWPLKEQDHQLPMLLEGYCGTASTFELFTDGSMSPHACMLYLRALSIHGFKQEAGALAADLDAGFAEGMFTGGFGLGMGRGNEFLCWDGLPGGYEGTFGPNMGALYAVAIEQGLFTPPEPEWWPAF